MGWLSTGSFLVWWSDLFECLVQQSEPDLCRIVRDKLHHNLYPGLRDPSYRWFHPDLCLWRLSRDFAPSWLPHRSVRRNFVFFHSSIRVRLPNMLSRHNLLCFRRRNRWRRIYQRIHFKPDRECQSNQLTWICEDPRHSNHSAHGSCSILLSTLCLWYWECGGWS